MREQESVLFHMHYFPHDGGWIKARYQRTHNGWAWFDESGKQLMGSPQNQRASI